MRVETYSPQSDTWDTGPPKANGGAEALTLAKLRKFSSINPLPLQWLWPGRIPLGKLTLVAGDPGIGKSLATVDVAARVSTGAHFPDGATCERGSVIILSAEDDPSDTIRPRLDAAGADVSGIHLLEAVRNFASDGKSVESAFTLERDVDALQDAIRQTSARLVIIDPISAYLGGTDSHTNADVRGLLSPLAALAGKHGAAVLAITHLRKSSGAAIYRTMGSLAFAAAARAVWGVVVDPEDKTRRLLLPVKQNLAPDCGGLAYRVEAPDGMARIRWEPGAIAADVNVLIGGFETREDHSERRDAEEWLRDFLAEGPQSAREIIQAARNVGVMRTTLWRAADSLGVIKRKLGGRGAGWEWSLKDSTPVEVKESTPIYTHMDSLNNELKTQGDISGKISKNPPVECISSLDSLSRSGEAKKQWEF